MPDLLIRNIDSHLKRRLEASARSHRRSLSEEARMLLRRLCWNRPRRAEWEPRCWNWCRKNTGAMISFSKFRAI